MSDTEIDEFTLTDVKRPQKTIKEVKVTPERIERETDARALKLEIAQKKLVGVYSKEPRVPVRVAPYYARYFGRVMRVSINGISIAVKCDGNTVELPESFAAEVLRRMYEMDRYDQRQKNMAKIQNNFEASPGQLNFFN